MTLDPATQPETQHARADREHIKIGVQLWPGGTPDYRTWRDAVLRAEDLGVDYIFGYDHFHKPFVEFVDGTPELSAEQPDVHNFEGWTALASWGEITTRAQIGLLVTGIGYRNPDLLADMARTVDHISGGRLILGLGSGWYPKDYVVYDYDYGTVASRFDLFEDGLARIHHRLRHLQPAPTRRIPILIGGGGERRTLPLVGRYADIWHSGSTLETFRRKNDLLKTHAAGFGRDEASITRAMDWRGIELSGHDTPDEFVDAGVTLFTSEVHPGENGYDFTAVEQMLSWRG